MMKNTTLVLMVTWSVACVAALGAPINLSSSLPKNRNKPAPIAAVPTIQVLPAPHTKGGVAVCTTFPGQILMDGAGHVYKIPVKQDAQGHQSACGSAVPLSQAPTDPVPTHVK